MADPFQSFTDSLSGASPIPQAPMSFNEAHPVGASLMALGTALGGVGSAQSGGRIPNIAAGMQAQAVNQYQLEIENKIRQKQQDMAESALKIKKIQEGWNIVEMLAKSGIPLTEDQQQQFAQKAADLTGDSGWTPLFAAGLKPKADAFRNIVPLIFGQAIEKMVANGATRSHAIDATVAWAQNPQLLPKLQEYIKNAEHDQAKATLDEAVSRGVNFKDMSAADAAKILGPGVLDKLAPEEQNQVGIIPAKTALEVKEAQLKGEPAQQRFEESQARLERESQLREQRFQQSQSSLERRHQESMNAILTRMDYVQQLKQNAPLDVNASRWINPKTLKPASPDMTPQEAKDQGYVTTSSTMANAIGYARTALNTLDKYEELSKKLLVSGTGKVGDIANIQANKVKQLTAGAGGDPDVRDFQGLAASLPAQVKAFGDTGNIAVKETEFAAKFLPNFDDSKEAALRKLQTRRQLLQGIIRGGLSSNKYDEPGQTGQTAVPKPATMRFNPATGKLEPIQ